MERRNKRPESCRRNKRDVDVCIQESQKRINADVANSYPMYDQEVMALAEELFIKIGAVPAYLLGR